MKNLFQRTLSGIVYLVFIIGSLLLGEYAFALAFLLICLLALIEYYDLTGIQNSQKIIGVIVGAFIFVLSFLAVSQTISLQYLGLVLIIPLILFIPSLYNPADNYYKNLPWIFMGLLLIAVPLSVINYLAFNAKTNYEYSHKIILGILCMIWVNDTGAYVFGSMLGKHKLFPKVSPKKSWEGLIGGTVFTFVAAFLISQFVKSLSLTNWIVLSAIVSVFGIYGDLFESLIKRIADKKDSGSIIPGHGGIFDRIDSVLFVVPVSAVYILLI